MVRKSVLRKEKHTLRARLHDEVIEHYQAVDVSLLVYHIGDETVNLAVDEGIGREDVWVFLMLVWRLSLVEHVPERSQEIVIPV